MSLELLMLIEIASSFFFSSSSFYIIFYSTPPPSSLLLVRTTGTTTTTTKNLAKKKQHNNLYFPLPCIYIPDPINKIHIMEQIMFVIKERSTFINGFLCCVYTGY